MKTTFLNGDAELKERGLSYMSSREDDFLFYSNYSHCEDINELIEALRDQGATFREARQAIRQFDSLGSFYDYGLSYDYVELGTFDDQTEDYFRYQLSWGGPSDELRFYEDGTIIYVFLDWFSGVGFDVTGEDWAEFAREWFNSCDMNFNNKREEYDYFEQLYALEEE